jgi:hypothetical protein
MCVGQIGKEYCILNKQYTKEEYEKEIAKITPLTSELIKQCFDKLDSLRDNYVHKYANILACENCTGNDISFSQNCLNNYITEYSQDCINGSSLRHCKDCLDFDLWGDPGELCYHTMSCGYNVYGLKMCFECWNDCRFLTYCDSCPSSEYCFGCVGLKHRKYCILNKQYTPEDYKKLEERIISDMSKSGEWGQFFPPYCSSHALNNSMCHEYFEIDKPLAKKLGFTWMDKSSEFQYDPTKVYKGSMISQDVKYEDIKDKVFLCSQTGKPYDIQKRELQILQQKKLPLPDKHWRVRMEERAEKFIFPWKLERRMTMDTKQEVLSPVPEKYQIREKALE